MQKTKRVSAVDHKRDLAEERPIICPWCGSPNTRNLGKTPDGFHILTCLPCTERDPLIFKVKDITNTLNLGDEPKSVRKPT